MENRKTLHIQKPCTEDFHQFTKTVRGGFCQSCTKEVVDFTNKSPKEIANYFQNHDRQKTCGRFRPSQLQVTYPVTSTKKRYTYAHMLGFAVLALFGYTKIQAQDITKFSKEAPKKIGTSIMHQTYVVEGLVEATGLPLPGVNIVLEGSNIGTVTDFDGNFEFPQKLKTGDVLVFSYLGFEPKKVKIQKGREVSKVSLKVRLEDDDTILMGDIVVKEVFASKKQ